MKWQIKSRTLSLKNKRHQHHPKCSRQQLTVDAAFLDGILEWLMIQQVTTDDRFDNTFVELPPNNHEDISCNL